MPKIIYLDKNPAINQSARNILSDFQIKTLPDNISEELLISEIKDAEYLVSGAKNISASYIENALHLKAILVPGAGYDHVNIKTANKHGIFVVNAPGANATAVAEMAFGLMLAIGRLIPHSHTDIKSGKWIDNSIRNNIIGTELYGKKLGLIGLGNIGRKVTKIAKGFAMQALCYTKNPSPERAEKAGVKFVDLSILLQKADFVVVAAALTPETEGLIEENEISLMKRNSYLINIARGPIVNYDDLYKALSENKIAGAGLDVFPKEPVGSTHPLLELDNIVLTAHLGARTDGAINKTNEIIADEILRIEAGDKPVHLINSAYVK